MIGVYGSVVMYSRLSALVLDSFADGIDCVLFLTVVVVTKVVLPVVGTATQRELLKENRGAR